MRNNFIVVICRTYCVVSNYTIVQAIVLAVELTYVGDTDSGKNFIVANFISVELRTQNILLVQVITLVIIYTFNIFNA